ncbi:toll/interleukin-1 receptor domain-containing protein [Acidicapsa acidisoli]|uniref:toll/interleukin-1 receptor domain-containing protein n=1 Tax=Acidicapsa acidisoli TaxID=1615681 RepID=UPI0021DFC997|nr:toll/interleukin-1 receptor domain-containing protein [Acidicapsa acidisoli]
MKQTDEEFARGVDYLRNIIESGKTLKMPDPRRLMTGTTYLIEVTGFTKNWNMGLTRDQICDIPGTKEYRESALALAQVLNSRFMNVDPNLYVTKSGRLLEVDWEWPLSPMVNEAGNAYISASALWVHLKDRLTGELARCAVKITAAQLMPGSGSNPFSRLSLIVNSIRSAVDSKAVSFHPTRELLGSKGDIVEFGYSATRHDDLAIHDFLSKKVWLLGFKAGRKDTQAWVSDPWDAAYLGCTTGEFHQAAAVLDAQERIVLHESGEFAKAGKVLLANNGPLQAATPTPQSKATNEEYDVFVSHATEDKSYVEPLARGLEAAGIKVWFDKISLEWGDDLRSAIDRGLKACRYGIVVFSKAFLAKKKWTEYELTSLFERESVGRKVILPIWHNITRDDLVEYSPGFAGRFAINSLTDSNADIVNNLLRLLGREPKIADIPQVAALSEMGFLPGKPKFNAVAYARYETTGVDAKRADVHIRPSATREGWFTYEDSFGEVQHATQDDIATRFVLFDRRLIREGYIRMNYANLAASRAFDL